MSAVRFPVIQVGDPLRHEALSVFPLLATPSKGVEYTLSDEAISEGTVTVEEVSEGGSVPELSVENKGDTRVLFLEGEELVGAKQNRVLNTSILVAAHTKTRAPVSCVEAGRWGYKSRSFRSGGTHSPSKLRRVLKASVSESLRLRRGRRSNQRAVWNEVAREQAAFHCCSLTSAMSDTFESQQTRLNEFREKMKYVDGAVGVAVAVGGKLVAVDLFDKAATCRRVWNRLLSGFVLDALEDEKTENQIECDSVQQLLGVLGDLPWELTQPIGEGEEYRAESTSGDHASALVLDETLVHGSVVCAG